MARARTTAGELKAAYTVAELVEMSGLTRAQVARIADNAGICGRRGRGRQRMIWLSELKSRCPEFWESILDRLALVAGRRDHDDLAA